MGGWALFRVAAREGFWLTQRVARLSPSRARWGPYGRYSSPSMPMVLSVEQNAAIVTGGCVFVNFGGFACELGFRERRVKWERCGGGGRFGDQAFGEAEGRHKACPYSEGEGIGLGRAWGRAQGRADGGTAVVCGQWSVAGQAKVLRGLDLLGRGCVEEDQVSSCSGLSGSDSDSGISTSAESTARPATCSTM